MGNNTQAVANTDRELWRERPGDYYADSIHVTESGGIGINVGGVVIVRSLSEWHRAMRLMMPMTAEEAEAAYDDAPAIPMTDEEIEAMVAKVTNQKYRKKPVVIDAIQWLGDNFVAVDEFVTCSHVTNPREGRVAIETLEGTMLAQIGDWIIRGVNGEFYPCKPDIFAKTYEAVM